MTRVRPSVFVGSSTEGLKIAKAMQVLLDHSCEVTIWSQGVFGLSQGSLESLVLALEEFDFAILVLTPDDMTTSRDETSPAPRDNVLFELGLFMGGLGRERTFLVYDRSAPIRLPSDLAGVTAATFEPHASGNLESAMGAPCTRIEQAVERLGLRASERLRGLSEATKGVEGIGEQVREMVQILVRSRKVELDVVSANLGPMLPSHALEQVKEDLRDLERVLRMEGGADV